MYRRFTGLRGWKLSTEHYMHLSHLTRRSTFGCHIILHSMVEEENQREFGETLLEGVAFVADT